MSGDAIASRTFSSPTSSLAAKVVLETVPVDRRSDLVLGLAQGLDSKDIDAEGIQHARLVIDLLSYCGQTQRGDDCLSEEEGGTVIDHLVSYVLKSVAATSLHDILPLREVIQLCGCDQRLVSEVTAVCVGKVLSTRQSMLQDATAFVVVPQLLSDQDLVLIVVMLLR
jgi:hypothetical protein